MSKPAGNPAPDRPGGQGMIYRKRRFAPPQTRDESRRQSDLVQTAWRHFGEAAPMIAFLNTHHDTLNAVPLALAIESDEGLEHVERLLRELTHIA